jgi:EmrB/QacA subfamily drug resistance transporter
MVVLDGTIVTVALPSIRDALGFSPTSLSWVMNAYALAFGGLLLLGGRAGDVIGRRRALILGVLIFVVASFVGGIASSASIMIAARVAQGVGAALAAPSTLSLIVTNFAEGRARNRAISVVSAAAASGAVIGLVAGGALTSSLSWRWVMLVNVPIGILIAVAAPAFIAETPRQVGRFDIAGTLTSTIGLTALVYGFVRAGSHGWSDPQTLTALAVGVVALAAFVRIERRTAEPLLPLRLVGTARRAVPFVAMLLVPAAMMSFFYFITLFVQDILGYTALQTGFAFIPIAGLILTSSWVTPALIARFGARPLVVTGLSLQLTGLLAISRVSVDSTYLGSLFLPIVVLGVGAGLTFTPLVTLIMGTMAPEDAGAASGLLQTAQQVGGAMGLGILTTVFGTVTRTGTAVEGISTALTVGASFTVLALVAVIVFAGRPARSGIAPAAPVVGAAEHP